MGDRSLARALGAERCTTDPIYSKLPLVASGANSEPTPGPVFDEASSGTAKGDAEYRRWRPGRRIAKNGPPVRVARKQKGLIRRMMNAEPRNSARPTAYRSLAREHSGLLGTYVCTHQGARNTSTSRHQQGVGPLFAPAATSNRTRQINRPVPSWGRSRAPSCALPCRFMRQRMRRRCHGRIPG